MRKRKRTGRARRALAASLSVLLALGLCGCKPTDFFTEVVIAPWATVVDEDNPDKVTVNSPDAAEETDQLPALDWTDASSMSQEVSNLVVYGSEPTTTLSTHHSIFDLSPRFPGIEASDGVRLMFEALSDFDHTSEADERDESAQDATSTSVGGAESTLEAEETSTEQEADETQTLSAEGAESDEGSTDSSEDDAGASAGTDQGGDLTNATNTGDGENNDNGGGTEQNANSGADGVLDVYDSGNRKSQINHVDSLAVIGTDVAVMAQSIGGEGAVCAMTEYAWYGKDEQGNRTATFSYFGEVFADEGAEDVQLLWSGDGSSPSDLLDVDALVAACGQSGLIVYDQRLGNQYTFFSEEQRAALDAAGIQLAPVDLSTAQGILDAATVLGDALQESSCAQDSQERASALKQAISSIVNAAANTSTSSPTALRCLVATEAESGLSFASDYGIDASGVVLFGNSDASDETPLASWGTAAGITLAPTGSSSYDSGADLTILWPLVEVSPDGASLTGGTAGDARSRWLKDDGTGGVSQMYVNVNGTNHEEAGLGSEYVPYLVVCASDLDGDGDSTTGEVKEAVVESMASRDSGGAITPYSVFPFYYDDTLSGWWPRDAVTGGLASTIGVTNYKAVSQSLSAVSPFYSGLALSDVVRENPVGLLGAWDEGCMESVLEAVWLADLYSHEASGCEYEAANDMSRFSCEIDGATCTSLEEAVKQFYQAFYRLDDAQLESAWQGAVPDTFEGLE